MGLYRKTQKTGSLPEYKNTAEIFVQNYDFKKFCDFMEILETGFRIFTGEEGNVALFDESAHLSQKKINVTEYKIQSRNYGHLIKSRN